MSLVRFFNLSEPVVPLFRDLGAALADEGHEVEFVVSRSSYRGGDDRLGTAVPNARVIATRGPSRQFETRVGRGLTMLAYWLGASWTILTARRPQVNVFLTQPPCFVGLGVRLAKLRRQPCIVVVMDVHPDELVSFNVLSASSLVARALDRLMRGALRRADRIIVIGRCMGDRIQAKGVWPQRVVVVPNWVDDKAILPVERSANHVRDALDWGDDFVLMYGGNVGHAQEFSTLIDVASRIDRHEGIRVAVVGDGSRASAVRAGMESASGGEYHPLLHQEFSLGEVLSAADAHFISLREECTGLGVPSKTYAAMAAGRPIVYEGSSEGEIHRTVTEHGIGAAIAPGDGDALLTTIRELAADKAAWRELCVRSREVVEAEYSAEMGVQRYLDQLRPWLGR